MENLGYRTRVRLQQLQKQHNPLMPVCAAFLCVQTAVGVPMFGISNMHADVDACDCIQGLYEHCKRVCTESRFWEKNPLSHHRIELTSVFQLAFLSDTVTTEQTRTLGNVSDSVCTLQTVFPSDQQSWHAHHTEDEEHEYISIQKPLFDIHSFTSKQVSWKFVH